MRGPELEFPRAPCTFARRKERKEASPTTLSLGTVFITVLPNTFGLRSSARESKGYYETAQLGAGCAGRIQRFEASYTRSVHSCRWSRAVPGIVTKRSQSTARLLLMRTRIIKRYNLLPRAGLTSCHRARAHSRLP